jgi:hypothetical protein
MLNEPVVPDDELPELNTRIPLAPTAPAFDDLIVIAPLVESVPPPLSMSSAPPVRTVVHPEVTFRRPPVPLDPSPTVRLSAPPFPAVALADPTEILPEVPELVVPELKISTPLVPFAPEFALRIVTAPLVDDNPPPEVIPMFPPVKSVLTPA